MHHIGYQTHHLPTGRYYIGIHSTEKIDDGYLGSGTEFLRAVRKHGRQEFRRHIVREFASRDEATEWERATVTAEVRDDPRSFNMKTGGGVAGLHSAETKRRMSVSQRARGPVPQELRDRISRTLTGRKLAPEHAAKCARNPLGNKHTPESLALMRAKQQARREAERAAGIYPGHPVEVHGVVYPNSARAAEAYKVNRSTVAKWIKTGRYGARRVQ